MRLNTKKDIASVIAQESDVVFVVLDGFDDALLGVATATGEQPRLAYDVAKILKELERMGMDKNEAEEYYEYNIECLYVGPGTPVLVDTRAFHE